MKKPRKSRAPLTTVEAAAYIGLSKHYLNQLRFHGGGPVFTKDETTRRVTYLPDALDTWNAARVAKNKARARSTKPTQLKKAA